jgi:hypothetical protein
MDKYIPQSAGPKTWKSGIRILKLSLIMVLIPFCSPDPSTELLESYSFQFDNQQGQRYVPGEQIDVSLLINNNKEPVVAKPFKIVFTVTEGGGSIARETVLTKDDARITNEWTLGPNSPGHRLKADIFRANGEYMTSVYLTAITMRENEWDPVSEEPDGTITDLAADTVAGVTLMISKGSLYRQGEKYYLWDKVVNPVLESPRTIEIDSRGIFYVSTWNGEIVKSTDHGISWQKCTKPFPDNPYYVFMDVANDDYVWVFKFEYQTVFSADGGATWQTAGSSLSSFGYGDVFRLKNGTLMFHGSNCCSLNRSDDNGLTWTHITTPGASTKLFVNDRDEIFICNQDGGFAIFRSTDLGATYTRLFGCSPQFGTSMDNIFNKWDDHYYILVPGYGVLKSYDLEHYETYWLNSELNNLFIDHNGVMIARDWNNTTVYYRKNSE